MYSKIWGPQYGTWFRSPFWHLKFGGDSQIFRMSVDLCCNQSPQTFASLACFQKCGHYNGIEFSQNLPIGLTVFFLPVNDSYYHLWATWKNSKQIHSHMMYIQCVDMTYVMIAVPLQTWSGPEGSRKLRFPDFMTTAQDGGKVVSPTHRPPLPPGNAPGTHFR